MPAKSPYRSAASGTVKEVTVNRLHLSGMDKSDLHLQFNQTLGGISPRFNAMSYEEETFVWLDSVH